MFKVLDKICEPTSGSEYSAYIDLYAREDCVIGAGETKLVRLGVKIDLEKLYKNWFYLTELGVGGKTSWKIFLKSHYLQLTIRSSLAVKGLMLGNGVGVIDLDFPDEIQMIIHNPIMYINKELDFDEREDFIDLCYMGASSKGGVYIYSNTFEIKKGDKIAQITLLEHKSYLFGIDTKKKRKGGFGSTGK